MTQRPTMRSRKSNAVRRRALCLPVSFVTRRAAKKNAKSPSTKQARTVAPRTDVEENAAVDNVDNEQANVDGDEQANVDGQENETTTTTATTTIADEATTTDGRFRVLAIRHAQRVRTH